MSAQSVFGEGGECVKFVRARLPSLCGSFIVSLSKTVCALSETFKLFRYSSRFYPKHGQTQVWLFRLVLVCNK